MAPAPLTQASFAGRRHPDQGKVRLLISVMPLCWELAVLWASKATGPTVHTRRSSQSPLGFRF